MIICEYAYVFKHLRIYPWCVVIQKKHKHIFTQIHNYVFMSLEILFLKSQLFYLSLVVLELHSTFLCAYEGTQAL